MRENTTLQKKGNNTNGDKETKKGNKRRIEETGGEESSERWEIRGNKRRGDEQRRWGKVTRGEQTRGTEEKRHEERKWELKRANKRRGDKRGETSQQEEMRKWKKRRGEEEQEERRRGTWSAFYLLSDWQKYSRCCSSDITPIILKLKCRLISDENREPWISETKLLIKVVWDWWYHSSTHDLISLL